jgi:hypothetical protein
LLVHRRGDKESLLLAALGMAAMGKALAPAHVRHPGKREQFAMAIYRLLQQSAFGPDDIDIMVRAYDDCLRTLNLADRSDPLTEIVAKKIIEIAQTGVRDPKRVRQLALDGLGLPSAE